MQLRARVLQIPARRRLVLSGTPVQNNLAELHALVDLTNPGLLGDAKEFREAYAKPISAGLHRAAAAAFAAREGGVLLSTYGMAQHATAALAGAAGPGGAFDWVVLDEGHNLRVGVVSGWVVCLWLQIN